MLKDSSRLYSKSYVNIMAKTDSTEKTHNLAAAPTPWSWFTAVMVVVAVYMVSTIAGQAFIVAVGLALGHPWDNLNDWLSGSTIAQFASYAFMYGLMAGLVYWFVRRQKGSLRALGVRAPRLSDFGVTLLGVPVYVIGYAIIFGIATTVAPSINADQQQQLGFKADGLHPALILTFISLVVLPPLVEEFIMRGFLFSSLLKRFKFVVAAIVTSVLFAVAHLQFGSGAPLLWVAAIDTFVLSLVLCYMRYKTGSLWPGIGLHMLKNFLAFSAVFVFPFIKGTIAASMMFHGIHFSVPGIPAL
jgi:membrane protease YdiL (CAAX protease family)